MPFSVVTIGKSVAISGRSVFVCVCTCAGIVKQIFRAIPTSPPAWVPFDGDNLYVCECVYVRGTKGLCEHPCHRKSIARTYVHMYVCVHAH